MDDNAMIMTYEEKLPLILIVVLASMLILGGCEDLFKTSTQFDISVKNDCVWQVYMGLTDSETYPPEYYKVNSGSNYTFMQIEKGNYYLYVRSYFDTNWYYFIVEIDGVKNYSLVWDIGKGGYILK